MRNKDGELRQEFGVLRGHEILCCYLGMGWQKPFILSKFSNSNLDFFGVFCGFSLANCPNEIFVLTLKRGSLQSTTLLCCWPTIHPDQKVQWMRNQVNKKCHVSFLYLKMEYKFDYF